MPITKSQTTITPAAAGRVAASEERGLIASADQKMLRGVAAMDESSISTMIDRWAAPLYSFTDALKLEPAEADRAIEEVFRRLMFEAPKVAATKDGLARWMRANIKGCAASVVAGRPRPWRDRIARESVDIRPSTESSAVAVRVQELIAMGGVPAVLAYLNSLTPFRFSGVYRFDGFSVVNLYLFDRENVCPADEGGAARTSDTYCMWIQEALSVVRMCDAQTDPRAAGHTKRDDVRSYCGGPIFGRNGSLSGTICHFDFLPHDVPSDIIPTLKDVGPLLGRSAELLRVTR